MPKCNLCEGKISHIPQIGWGQAYKRGRSANYCDGYVELKCIHTSNALILIIQLQFLLFNRLDRPIDYFEKLGSDSLCYAWNRNDNLR